jgi:uncharacterized protein (DUF697 family)
MSDDKTTAKPRRRRLYQEVTEETVSTPAKAAASKPTTKQTAQPATPSAAQPEAKATARASEKPDTKAAAKSTAKPAAAGKAAKTASTANAQSAAKAAPKAEARMDKAATEQPAAPQPIEGEFIAATEKVKFKTEPTVVPQRLHESPLLCNMKAKQAVRDHALLSGGTAAVPIPFLDMVADAAVQVRMIKRLAEIYGIDFAEERAKTLAVAALGGFSAGWAAGGLLRYASFAMYFANFWPSAILSAAITYAIGQVFIHHFEKGGSLHDLSPEAAASILKEKAMNLRRKKAGMKATEAAA